MENHSLLVSQKLAMENHNEETAEAAAKFQPERLGVVTVPAGCRGPRSLYLRRDGDSFGFTLRHFILYPPDSAEDPVARRLGTVPNSSDARPLETIFVKEVVPGGAAERAGLHTGDRLVSVNDQSLEGKTYAEVVRMVKNSPPYLHLLVYPKEHDVLQKFFYETAHNPESNRASSRHSWARPDSFRRESVGSVSIASSLEHTLEPDSPAMTRMRKSLETMERFLGHSQQAPSPGPASAPACIVQRRTRQFESGAPLSPEEGGVAVPDRTSLYRSELSRLSAAPRSQPTVAVRRKHFEQATPPVPAPRAPKPVPTPRVSSLSGNQIIPIGNSKPHCQPPASEENHVTPAPRLKTSSSNIVRPRSSELPANQVILVGSHRLHCAPAESPIYEQVSSSSDSLADERSKTRKKLLTKEEKATRRISYLRACDNISSDTDQAPSSESETRSKSGDSSPISKEMLLHCKFKEVNGKKISDKSWVPISAMIANGRLFIHGYKNTELEGELDDGLDLRGCSVTVSEDWHRRRPIVRVERAGLELALRPAEPTIVNRVRDACSEIPAPRAEPQVQASGEVRLSPQQSRSRSPPLRKQQHLQVPSQSQSQPHTPETTPPPALKTSWRGRVARQFRRFNQSGTGSPTSSGGTPDMGLVFRIPLEMSLPGVKDSLVPRLVEMCTMSVEKHGLDMVGIYRVPGNSAAVSTLTAELDKGQHLSDPDDPCWSDMNVVSSVLKSFFRKLPDSLLTSALYPHLIAASKVEEPRRRLEEIRHVVGMMPKHNYATLRHLILHLEKVIQHNPVNKMDSRNLAIVFGPTLVRYSEENMATMVTDMSHQCKIVESFLCHAKWFFADGELPERVPSMEGYAAQDDCSAASNSLLLGNISKVENLNSKKYMVSSLLSAARKKGRKLRGSLSGESTATSPTTESKDLPGTKRKDSDGMTPSSALLSIDRVDGKDEGLVTTGPLLSRKPSNASRASADSAFEEICSGTGPDLVSTITSIYDLKLKKLQTLDADQADIPFADETPSPADSLAILTKSAQHRVASLLCDDKENVPELIQQSSRQRFKDSKLKRKNGMPERSIKRRHTVGGTKDLDKVTAWYRPPVRTSSPDLTAWGTGRSLCRPQSAPDPPLGAV